MPLLSAAGFLSYCINRLCGPMIHSVCSDSLLSRGTSAFLAVLIFAAATHGGAQQPGRPVAATQTSDAPVALPDAPLAIAVPPAPVFSSAVHSHPPMTAREKFVFATNDAFSPSSAFFTGADAGLNHLEHLYPEFHQGAAGYGRYFWHAYADQAIDSYVKDFMLPTVLHEDPRYYRLGSGGFLKRTGNAFGHVLITRSDSGQTRFNTSQIVGSGVSVSIETLYYPGCERTGEVVARNWAMDLLGAGLLNGYQEFTPEIHRVLKSFVPHILKRED